MNPYYENEQLPKYNLPIAVRLALKVIGIDLVTVQPLGPPVLKYTYWGAETKEQKEEREAKERMENRVKKLNEIMEKMKNK